MKATLFLALLLPATTFAETYLCVAAVAALVEDGSGMSSIAREANPEAMNYVLTQDNSDGVLKRPGANRPIPAHQPIPAAMTEPVISLDAVSRSGAGPSTLRVLAIAAEGGVAVSSGGGVVRPFDAQLTPAELAELRTFILEQQRFASIDGPALARQVGSVTDDAATVVISVATAGGVHRVALEALPDAAALRPGIEPLQRLHAVYQRLMRLVHVTIVGGDDALEAAVAAVNAVLAREHPGAQPLGGQHLLEAHALPDGGVRLSLLRVDAPAAGQPGLRWYAEVQRPASGQPQVRIWRRPD